MIVSTRPRMLGLLLAAVVLVAVAPRPALGCSCMEPADLGAMLDEAQAAFVGTMVERRIGKDEFDAVYVFEVETWVKSDLGKTVDIHSGSNSAMCGFEQPTGQRVGLLVYFDGEQLGSGLCSMVGADDLIALSQTHVPRPGAVEPLPPESIGVPGQASEQAATTARVALGVLAAAGIAGVFASRIRRRSVEEQ